MIKNGNAKSYIYKVGSESSPATEEDIDNLKEAIEKAEKTSDGYLLTSIASDIIKLQEQPERARVAYDDPKQMRLFD